MQALWYRAQASLATFVICSQLLCSKKTKPTNDYAPGKNRKAEEALDMHAGRAHTRPGAIKSGSLGGLSSSQSCSTELLFPPVTPTPIPTERQSILLLKRKAAEGHIAVDVWELGRQFY